jgi:hypothetical protein
MSAIGNFSLAIRNEDGIDCASSLYLALFSGGNMMRRLLLSRLASLPFFALGASKGQAPPKKLKIMMKSAWGPDDPTRAAFPFAHGLVLAEAGHDVQIFLLAEATSLLRKSMVSAILPVGWPPLSETLDKVVARHIPVFA